MMYYKLKSSRYGTHIHLKIWAGENRDALGLCGELTMKEGEYTLFVTTFLLGQKKLDKSVSIDLEDCLYNYVDKEKYEPYIFRNAAETFFDGSQTEGIDSRKPPVVETP